MCGKSITKTRTAAELNALRAAADHASQRLVDAEAAVVRARADYAAAYRAAAQTYVRALKRGRAPRAALGLPALPTKSTVKRPSITTPSGSKEST